MYAPIVRRCLTGSATHRRLGNPGASVPDLAGMRLAAHTGQHRFRPDSGLGNTCKLARGTAGITNSPDTIVPEPKWRFRITS